MAFGICGRMGAGKSTLAALLSRGGGCGVVEVDDLRRHALGPSVDPRHVTLRRALGEAYGLEAAGESCVLDGAALASRLFAGPGSLEAFSRVAGPVLREDARRAIGSAPGPVALVWANLVEDGMLPLLDGPLVIVTCPLPVALRRSVRPGDLAPGKVRARLVAQPDDPRRVALARSAGADVVVVDGGGGFLPSTVAAVARKVFGGMAREGLAP